MSFVPADFTPPDELRTEHLHLRILAPDVTELDYDALMESRARLRQWSASSWPADDFTLDANRDDLAGHVEEWNERIAFAYTVLNPDDTACEGCCYINPINAHIRSRRMQAEGSGLDTGENTAGVGFWVRDSAQPRELDRELLDGLIQWLQRDWPFAAIYFVVNGKLTRDIGLYRDAGLEEPIILHGENDNEWQFWRLPAKPR
jgi:RimJ/RimL family protein N-acetyltransferase